MEQMKGHKLLFHLLAWIVIISQVVIPSAYADIKDSNKFTSLAVPSIFAASSPSQESEAFKNSVLSDIKFLTVAFSIAAHFLVDNRNGETLTRDIRNEFRNRKDLLKILSEINLNSVYLEYGVVHIPFAKYLKDYEVRIFLKKKFNIPDESDSERAVSEKFAIQVAEQNRTDEENAIIKNATKTIKIPDFNAISLKAMIEGGLKLEDWQKRGRCKGVEYTDAAGNRRIAYYFSNIGEVLTGDNLTINQYRIIKHSEIRSPEGEHEGDILIYYYEKENAVTVIFESANKNEPVVFGNEMTRGEAGWDKGIIKIYLDWNGDRISIIDHKITDMGLSRTTIGIMMEDASLEGELPELYNMLKAFLAIPDITNSIRARENKNESIIPISIISKINKNPESATEDEIKILEGFADYKSWAVRGLALNALHSLMIKGIISPIRFGASKKLFEIHHIEEDLLFINRLLMHDSRLLPEILQSLYGVTMQQHDIDHIEIKWYDSGANKNIYTAGCFLKDGRNYNFAISTIRHDPIGSGLKAENIDKSNTEWIRLSQGRSDFVPQFGAFRWAFDYRPRIADCDILPVKPQDDPEGIGKGRWIRNDISIVFREFVEGANLETILARKETPQAYKKAAIKASLEAYLGIWNETKDDSGKGLFVGDPKPANVVVNIHTLKAKVVDLDALREFSGFEEVRKIIRQYPEYDELDILYVDGKAIVVEKNDSVDKNGIETDEPLIGHGFTNEEVDSVKITPWNESEAFKNILAELESVIRARAPDTVRQELLNTIEDFKQGKDGRNIGLISSKYKDAEHYYLGFGTSKSVSLAYEFLDTDNLLNNHSVEALFHEIFHALKGTIQNSAEIEADKKTHVEAMRLAAQLFWGVSESDAGRLTLEELEKHANNRLGQAIRAWKKHQQALSGIVIETRNGWKGLRDNLKSILSLGAKEQFNRDIRLRSLINLCDQMSEGEKPYPIESRYPVLRAVTLLSKDEQDKLVAALKEPQNEAELRGSATANSILLMLQEDVPDNLSSDLAADLKGRSVWQVASEIWYPAGGLARVMQFHSIPMAKFFVKHGISLRHIEPFYHLRHDKSGNEIINGIDYYASLPSEIKDIKEICRYPVKIGIVDTWAVVYKGRNKYGIEVYLIGDTGKNAGRDGSEPYYTRAMYEYKSKESPNLVAWHEFSAFMSMASVELVRLVEEENRRNNPDAWRAPIVHTNDAQPSLFDMYRDILSESHPDDYILNNMHVEFSTHTYPNRGIFWVKDDGHVLRDCGIPERYWKYFERDWGWDPKYDFTSAAIRWAYECGNWIGGVSRKHVSDVVKFDKWGEWSGLNLIAVTNGDQRYLTAAVFRDIMKSIYPGIDVEHPEANQVLESKKEAKKRLDLDPDQYVVSYSGRLVPEKTGGRKDANGRIVLSRAFKNENIIELVKMGIQVVIYGNVQGSNESRQIADDLRALQAELDAKRRNYPGEYAGRFIFIPRFEPEEQRALLAATDIHVYDSDEQTEAAGFSEADIAACGGLVLAPPWTEGILQAQGIPINLDVPGEGNTLIPEDSRPESYLKILKAVLSRTPGELAEYQATSIRLSRVLEARLTMVEYIRQWVMTAAKKETAKTEKVRPVVTQARNNMDILNLLDKELLPPVEAGKTLWHVIPVSLIPQSPDYNQQTRFIAFVNELNRLYPNSGEKIKVVTDRQSVEDIVKSLASDPDNIVDVALDSEGTVDKLPDGVKALVFKPKDGKLGDFRQLEGILAALRALHIKDPAQMREKLARIYRLLTGEAAQNIPEIADPREFAKKFIFILPPIEIRNKEELRRLNENLLELIKSA